MAAADNPDGLLPRLSALALVCFDNRRGNSVIWQRQADGLELSDGLEYKALPSALHTVESDLVYFIHGSQAGLSAFENIPNAADRRNASFFAVAALTPRNGSRLGKIWLHATHLQALSTSLRDHLLTDANGNEIGAEARDLPAVKPQASQKLETFWERYRDSGPTKPSLPLDSQQKDNERPALQKKRRRGLSESVPFAQAPNTHPANSVSLLLDTLGPLIFPLYRCTLLRQRILLLRKPPLQPLCDFVYLLSILSGIPAVLADGLPFDPPTLNPLFTIGIYDIFELESRQKANTDSDQIAGYIACSSDELLATKPHLFDIKVEIPPPTNSSPWPKIINSAGVQIKATQRDLRHYKALRSRIHALYEPNPLADLDIEDEESPSEEDTTLLPHNEPADPFTTWTVEHEAQVAEPLPWAAIAYDSFIWWASAGERDADFSEERDFDHDLLDAAFTTEPRPASPIQRRREMNASSSSEDSFEMSVVAYFLRLTTVALERLSEIVPLRAVPSPDGRFTDEEGRERGFVTKADLMKMGLDIWSKSDRTFVEQLARQYFDGEVEVQGATVDCCGVQLL